MKLYHCWFHFSHPVAVGVHAMLLHTLPDFLSSLSLAYILVSWLTRPTPSAFAHSQLLFCDWMLQNLSATSFDLSQSSFWVLRTPATSFCWLRIESYTCHILSRISLSGAAPLWAGFPLFIWPSEFEFLLWTGPSRGGCALPLLSRWFFERSPSCRTGGHLVIQELFAHQAPSRAKWYWHWCDGHQGFSDMPRCQMCWHLIHSRSLCGAPGTHTFLVTHSLLESAAWKSAPFFFGNSPLYGSSHRWDNWTYSHSAFLQWWTLGWFCM
jgi:hypothetical protein